LVLVQCLLMHLHQRKLERVDGSLTTIEAVISDDIQRCLLFAFCFGDALPEMGWSLDALIELRLTEPSQTAQGKDRSESRRDYAQLSAALVLRDVVGPRDE